MPYIDTYAWFDVKLKPQTGETYQVFIDRCCPAILQLKPDFTHEAVLQVCNDAWADHVLRNAQEVTLTMQREMHFDPMYLDGWWEDWKVTDIHAAALPSVVYTSVEKAKVSSGKAFNIAKSAEDEQLVFGWANISVDAAGHYPIDWDGDITAPEDLEKAAYDFVLKYRASGEQHQGEVKGNLVESIMFTKEKQDALGIPAGVLPQGWWVGFHVPDKEVFAKIKSGEYEMFSVEGKAVRVPTDA